MENEDDHIYKDCDDSSSTGSGGSGCDELGSGRRSSCDDLNARRASCGSIHPSMFGNHGIFAPAEVSVGWLVFKMFELLQVEPMGPMSKKEQCPLSRCLQSREARIRKKNLAR